MKLSQADTIARACMDAAELISQADGLLITAGAGISIDSGMPDFRGDRGFWHAYPGLGTLGMRFHEIANPRAFRDRPEVAWGFYGHRLALYRATAPHAGFGMLKELASAMPKGAFVFNSNVDGHFQKAGFDPERVAECHGSIHHMQCLAGCGQPRWPAGDFVPVVDNATCTLRSALPRCPACHGVARPNILMFNDDGWIADHADRTISRLETWLARLQRPVVLEIGAGTAIPTVRRFGESIGCPLIRVNTGESQVGLRRDIAIPLGALDGLSRIHAAFKKLAA
ncbi:NAD-dependent deacetylase [Duganella sp. FT3S]|uniref:protein acetyllysine N-acetyltransferase n=1 Tax=Rugamonas fusca TaxID=2758568 RepID=A0A7W2EHI0_9BURK|nr:Sir2 family NAD-dependent protein deacetylase [Rugamonas fusca]MBA5606011.1 NAD-dependent deacetylase [Rugamonas fusca]